MPAIRSRHNQEKFSSSPEAVLRAAMEALACCGNQQCSLDEYLDSKVEDPLLRRRLSNLLFTFYRRKRPLERAINQCCSKAPEKALFHLLCAALTMGAFQDSLPPASVVNIAVTLSKKEFGNAKSKFVNAVLRKALEHVERDTLELLPEALEKKWRKNFAPEKLSEFSALFSRPAPATVRLRSNFPQPDAEAPGGLSKLALDTPWSFFQVSDSAGLIASEPFRQGAFYIQDPAPAKVCRLLQDFINELPTQGNFIDLCAAPGGKLLMNMELLLQHGKVYQPWAIDRSAKRLQLVKENLQRCRMACKTIPADAAEFSAPDALKFELVTCDVPCSNTGVFRHRPDALWRWSRQSLNEVTLLQKKILCNAAELTAPGGLLLYSTCSLEAEENQLLIDEFVAQNPEFELKSSQLFLPDAYCDGTFAALLQRKKTNGQDVVVQA